MKLIEVVVTKGRKFDHEFSGQKVEANSEVTLKVVLEQGDIPSEVVAGLQSQAEDMLEDHQDQLIRFYKEREDLVKKEMFKIWIENGGKFPSWLRKEE